LSADALAFLFRADPEIDIGASRRFGLRASLPDELLATFENRLDQQLADAKTKTATA
jgi:hypothetical protein